MRATRVRKRDGARRWQAWTEGPLETRTLLSGIRGPTAIVKQVPVGHVIPEHFVVTHQHDHGHRVGIWYA